MTVETVASSSGAVCLVVELHAAQNAARQSIQHSYLPRHHAVCLVVELQAAQNAARQSTQHSYLPRHHVQRHCTLSTLQLASAMAMNVFLLANSIYHVVVLIMVEARHLSNGKDRALA